ncbi:uncharacterized protein BN486_03675 [Clostridium clostridioforme CAG:132]|uniref:Acyltransferase 3 domain-containing protein n=2 Tax=Enterocloster clostridioformis TaxID=1531 RepID=R6JLW0_9FIRM|nr:uncharacterized protein BN486_03675 [[Clostridium] clostridioforme CAG:132]
MISGYFYNQESAVKRIRKIAILFVEANLIYCAWSYFYGFVSGKLPVTSIDTLIRFIFLNESPFSGHLWYLGAVLYTQIVIYLLEKWKLKRALYMTVPILLLTDIVFGKYSILLFGREFDYHFVRNWLFVGIPFFSIGMLMNEKNLRIGWWGIPVFTLTTMLERFLLVRNGLNAARDQYISTIFLSISVMSFALKYKGNIHNWLAQIGKRLSAWIYIIHPIFVTCLTFIASKIGMQKVWGYVGAVFVFTISVVFVYIFAEMKRRIIPHNLKRQVEDIN